MQRKATSFDVARLAGVSQPTVSRALRNLPSVAPQTRERVLRAARQLAYVTQEPGRILATRSTRRIAVVTEALTNPFYAELVEPLRNELGKRGYRVALIADDPQDILTADALTDGSFAGAIITTATRDSSLSGVLRERGLPHVFAGRVIDDPEAPCCGFDNVAGGRLIGAYLADSGHTRIGVIGGPTSLSTSVDRMAGLTEALHDRFSRLRASDVRHVEYSTTSGRTAAIELLARAQPPTAIVCGNDVVAVGVMNAARSLGLRIPEDVSVIGFDDIPLARWDVIQLTTIRCDLELLAAEAVRIVVDQIASGITPGRVTIPVELVIRESVAIGA